MDAEWTDIVRYAEVLKQNALPAGIQINIKTIPTSQYWEKAFPGSCTYV